MSIDYRVLNKHTIKYQIPLLRVDEIWSQMGGAKVFSTVDLRTEYNQMRIRESNREKPAFRTRDGWFEYPITQFGVTGAPNTFKHT